MPDEYHIVCTETDRLRRLEEATTEIQVGITAIQVALLGTFEHGGLCTRTEQLEARQQVLWGRVDEIAGVLIGNGKIGLNERVRILEAVKTRNERLSWLLVASILAQVLIILRESVFGG